MQGAREVQRRRRAAGANRNLKTRGLCYSIVSRRQREMHRIPSAFSKLVFQVASGECWIRSAKFNLAVMYAYCGLSASFNGHIWAHRLEVRGAFDSAKNHKRQRRKRQSVTAKREKSQTP